jgi:hypothetical protein
MTRVCDHAPGTVPEPISLGHPPAPDVYGVAGSSRHDQQRLLMQLGMLLLVAAISSLWLSLATWHTLKRRSCHNDSQQAAAKKAAVCSQHQAAAGSCQQPQVVASSRWQAASIRRLSAAASTSSKWHATSGGMQHQLSCVMGTKDMPVLTLSAETASMLCGIGSRLECQ